MNKDTIILVLVVCLLASLFFITRLQKSSIDFYKRVDNSQKRVSSLISYGGYEIGKVETNNENVKVLYLQPLKITPDEEYMYIQGCIGSECFDKFIIPSSRINTFQIENHLGAGDFTTWSGDSRYELLGTSKYTTNFFSYDATGRLAITAMFWLDEISKDDKKSDSKDFSPDGTETVYKKESVEVSIKTLDSLDGSVSLETPIELSLPLLTSK